MVVPTRVLLWFFAESVAGGAPLTVVSAANGRYALKEIAVMLEVGMMSRRENIETRLIAYNLGGGWCPPGRERTRLYEEFGIEYRDFDFSKYPRHVSNLGCYAWKAPMVVEVARQVGNESVVMWIDSGVAFHQSVKSVITATRRNLGFVSDSTSFSIARFSHERMLDYFVENLSFNATYAQQLVQKRRSGYVSLRLCCNAYV